MITLYFHVVSPSVFGSCVYLLPLFTLFSSSEVPHLGFQKKKKKARSVVVANREQWRLLCGKKEKDIREGKDHLELMTLFIWGHH